MPTESILKLLENGEWHYLKDLPKETSLNSLAVGYIAKFLEKYDLVKLDPTKQRIRLDQTTTKFLKVIRDLENEERQQKI